MQTQADQTFIQQHLRSIIIHALDNFNYESAEFASERLLADDLDNLASVYLYCLTLYRQGKYKACFNRSSNLPDDLGCSYIYARLCLKLKKYKEGIFQLLKVGYLYNEASEAHGEKAAIPCFLSEQSRYNYESHRQIGPDQSTIYHLLGDLYRGIGDTKNSAMNYSSALKYNPFDFEAFLELCKLGVGVKTNSIFKPKPADVQSWNLKDKTSSPSQVGTDGNTISNPFSSTTPIQGRNNAGNESGMAVNQVLSSNPDESFNNSIISPKFKGAQMETGKGNLGASANPLSMNFEFTKPVIPTDTAMTTANDTMHNKKNKRESAYSKITSRLISQPNNNKKNIDINSSMNSGSSALNKRSNAHGGIKRNNAGNNSNNVSILGPQASSFNILINKEIEASNEYLLELYHIFANGFKSMCKYNCYKAIRIFDSLPEKEKETPWVLSKLGMLHYEIVNYKQSEYFFVKLRSIDRTRLEDMEYYSTLLWHLHKKVELTYLANELHDLDPKSAITWCTIGNLFSLMREPDEAIKCFNKAIKMDENFTYAYTLKGHEYFGNDNYEMALENFRISLLMDSRHYNALYGIGMVYINLGDYQKADYHFRKAISINPVNIILICCVGMVLEKMGKKNLALRQYELANKLQPLNPLPIFKKAQLLFSMQQFQQALHYFEILKECAPDEASVHFLLGQLYNIQNDKFQAIREFTIALNLDPKGNYLIREAMEATKER